MQIKVGDNVRSFDFPDRSRDLEGELACFVEGEVVDIIFHETCNKYKIKVTREVWCGEEMNQRQEILAPVNGTPRILEGVCDGVELITE